MNIQEHITIDNNILELFNIIGFELKSLDYRQNIYEYSFISNKDKEIPNGYEIAFNKTKIKYIIEISERIYDVIIYDSTIKYKKFYKKDNIEFIKFLKKEFISEIRISKINKILMCY
jgi:hypothetical protein